MSVFKALCYRNLLLYFRAWKKVLIDVLTVVVVFLILIYNPNNVERANLPNGIYRISDGMQPDDWPRERYPNKFLGFTPPNDHVFMIVEAAAAILGLAGSHPFTDAAEMESEFYKHDLFAGVEFSHVEQVEKRLYITIRYPAKFRTLAEADTNGPYELYWESLPSGVLEKDELKTKVEPDLYLREGMLSLQQAIVFAWQTSIEQKEPKSEFPPKIDVFELRAYQHYSCPLFKPSNVYDFLMYFCFFPAFCNILWRFGREVEQNLPFHHWKMGCSFTVYWFVNYMMALAYLFMLDIILLLVIKIKWIPILETYSHTRYIDFMILYLFYNSSLIMLAIVIATAVLNAKNAVFIGAAWWIVNYSFFALIVQHERIETHPFTLFACAVFPNNDFIAHMFWLRFFSSHRRTFYLRLLPIVGNIFLTLILFVLIYPWRPGQYLYSPSVKKAYFSCGKRKRASGVRRFIHLFPQDIRRFEFGGSNKKLVAYVRNVTTFLELRGDNAVPALKNVSFRVFAGDITVILGPIQSGKTTICRVLAGWQAPDIGRVFYADTDIHAEWAKVGRMSDILLPYHPLFDLLTVNEHLCYIIRLKAGKIDHGEMRKIREKWEYYIESFITDDNIIVKKIDQEKQRLLSLCFTLACKQTLVILDDATTNLTFRNQHIFWEILKNEKQDRAIVLTTSSMSEADLIGDSIAILENGALMAMGSSFFLKATFSVFDKMIVYKVSGASTERITRIVRRFFPKVMAENDVADSVLYKIPREFRKQYQKALIVLEKNSIILGIKKIKILSSDLREISQQLNEDLNVIKYQPIITRDFTMENQYEHVSARRLCCSQIKGMCFKKMMEYQVILLGCVLFFVMAIVLPVLGFIYGYNSEHPLVERHTAPMLRNRALKKFSDYGSCEYLQLFKMHSGLTKFKCEHDLFTHALKETFLTEKSIGAIEKYRQDYTIWFNQRNFHSAPLMLEMYHNLVLSAAYDESYLVSVGVKPVGYMPKSVVLSREFSFQNLFHFIGPIIMGVMMPIFTSYFIVPLVRERQGHFLDLLELNGIFWDSYWFVTFLFDFWAFACCCLLYFLIVFYTNFFKISLLIKIVAFVVTLAYGFSILPIIYFISFFKFASAVTAYLMVLVMQLCGGILLFLFYVNICNSPMVLYYAAMILPPFAMVDGFFKCAVCSHVNGCSIATMLFRFSELNVLVNIVYMLVSTVLATFGVYLFVDYKRTAKYRIPKHIREYRSVIDLRGDSDVSEIKQKVADMTKPECLKTLVCVDQLEYKLDYQRKLHTVSFLLEPGEILCIKGPRFSGKSHMARQLVGLADHQFGEVYVHGKGLKIDVELIQKIMGYCPQTLSLKPSMTLVQHLSMLLLIRGVEKKTISSHIRNILNLLNSKRFCYKPAQNLSYDEQRKVAVALACIGNPQVIVFDEPTAGLAHNKSREIWDVIRIMRYIGKGIIVFTDHSPECEALGGKIMVADRYRMLGYNSLYNMKLSYSSSIIFEAKLIVDGGSVTDMEANLERDMANLHDFVMFLDDKSKLIHRKNTWIRYKLPLVNVEYSKLWGAIEKAKQRLGIIDYSIFLETDEFYRNMLFRKRKNVNLRLKK